MCHFTHDDLERREAELRRQAAELLKRADAIHSERQADAERAAGVRSVKEDTFA